MISTEPTSPPLVEPAVTRTRAWLEVGLVFAVFFVHAGEAAPAVNETHYLGKAKHYGDPSFCPGDLFLESADTHVVFFWSTGWLANFVSLEAFAWCGRLVTWALLAWAWCRLSRALVPTRWFAVLSAGLFVAGSEWLHMAGEWVVGGFEAKGLAYGFMLLALESLVLERWSRTWLLLGAASAFHVLVGGWIAVAVAVAWLFSRRRRPTLVSMLPALLGGAVLALFGLWPALTLNWGEDASLVRQAHVIYVYRRLSHHLVFTDFPPLFIARHLLLWGAWAMLCWIVPMSHATRRLRAVVWASGGIAATGAIISVATSSYPQWGAALLRYYWFRPSDVMAPLGVALLSAVGLNALGRRHVWFGRWGVAVAVLLIGCHLTWKFDQHREPATGANPMSRDSVLDADWLDACRWIATSERIAPDALFLTPRSNRSDKRYTHFKWHAQRGEVVAWKDVPQDAATIKRWWDRMRAIHYDEAAGSWRRSLAEAGERELEQWGRRYGAEYCITTARPRLNLPLEYRNRSFAIYRLGD